MARLTRSFRSSALAATGAWLACVTCLLGVASPLAHAQQRDSGSSSASSPDSDANGGSFQGDTMTSALRRSKADEKRLLGGPSASQDSPYDANPYTADGASPMATEHALTSESRMQMVNPSDFYAASNAAAASPTRSGSADLRKRIGHGGAKYSGGAASDAKAAYDYGASQTSPNTPLYGSPYASQRQSASQLYKSPW